MLVDFFAANISFSGSTTRYVCTVHLLNKENSGWVAFGIVAVAASIALAAYGRHGIEDTVLQNRWSIAMEYLRDMGFGILVLSLMRSAWLRPEFVPWPERMVGVGTLFFSGVLMLESMSPNVAEQSLLRFAPPLGGILLIISWLWFLLAFVQSQRPE